MPTSGHNDREAQTQRDVQSNHESEFDVLLQRALAGDAQAIDRVVESLRPYLLLIANRNLDRDLQGKLGASDLVQSALVAAHQGFAEFRGTSVAELNRWVTQILNNNLIDARRRYKGAARRNVEGEVSMDDSRVAPPEIADSMETPRRLVAKQEQENLVEQALAELPENYRRVIKLRNWEGQGFREIGEQFGTGEDAARKLWARALLRLNDVIREKYPELDSMAFRDAL